MNSYALDYWNAVFFSSFNVSEQWINADALKLKKKIAKNEKKKSTTWKNWRY